LTTGVVVMAYGTPATTDDIEPYYTHIRRGRPPAPEQLAELRMRYDAIGGLSPLHRITQSQRDVIEQSLGEGYDVRLGYKHASPFIEEAVAQLAVDDIVGVVLAPHYSRGSVGEYVDRLGHRAVESWHDLPEWRAFHAEAIERALATMPSRTHVVFTAHSLPERVLEGDRYEDELMTSATAIAETIGLGAGSWSIGWQSAGRTPEPWRGPDIAETLTTIEADGVVVCPQGFVSDSLEILYDLDMLARDVARDARIVFARTPMVNDDATVLGALADRVRSLSA
jgi:ferrochelatase